jgi:tRNA pseudouridine32 synthase / 23S rRNA pseudouridine746 synthase
VAVDKPSGLLSVPGRGGDRMDSAWTRLRQVYPQVEPVHRLDQDTSGVLLFAKDRAMQQQVHRLFEQRQVQKRYEALVVGTLVRDAGQIELPLWSDPTQRPRQVVDMQRGKPAVTEFRLLSQGDSHARVALYPHTGRTHQLRVHAAEGLGCPIVGDRLYGEALQSERLHLHACELQFTHPRQGKNVAIASPLPF